MFGKEFSILIYSFFIIVAFAFMAIPSVEKPSYKEYTVVENNETITYKCQKNLKFDFKTHNCSYSEKAIKIAK